MPTHLTVSLRDMRFHVRVGILPHERELPQPLTLDLSVRVAEGERIDYRELYALVEATVSAEPLAYLEEVATAISDAALDLPAVQGVRVVVRKPHVALPGPLAGAEIVLERTRSFEEATRPAPAVVVGAVDPDA